MRDRNGFGKSDGLAQALLRERQAERKRIARILHDQFLQQCQAIVLALESGGVDPVVLAGEAREAIALGRDLILELRQADGAATLKARLAILGRQVCARAGIRFECLLSDRLAGRADPFSDELYMCLAEAIRNAARHARAATIRVRDAWTAGAVVVSVTDDGIGIPAAVLQDDSPDRHFGLAGMRERAASIGGTVAIAPRERDNAARGTAVDFRFDREQWGRHTGNDDENRGTAYLP
jgi:signal transduction histidine kinase